MLTFTVQIWRLSSDIVDFYSIPFVDAYPYYWWAWGSRELFFSINVMATLPDSSILLWVTLNPYSLFCCPYMEITRSTLPQNNGNLPLPFLVVITQFLSWMIFINYCKFILSGSPG